MLNAGSQGIGAHSIQAHRGRGLPGRPVVVGEVLYDLFEDGARVLGGAPFNVAWHLHGFGLDPLLISRVGDDDLGRQIREEMREWGMDTSGLRTDPNAPTGQVRVALRDGEPAFDILPDQAYDRVNPDDAMRAVDGVRPALLYHGTLIGRSTRGSATVASLRDRSGLPAFVDVNLREPWWAEPEVHAAVAAARWAKMNTDELATLTERNELADETELHRAADQLRHRHGLEQLIVTLGGAGAIVSHADRTIAGAPARQGEVVDTVGAGDAFSAVWIAGLIRGWSAERTLARALDFAAEICALRGAVARDRELYRRHLDTWSREAS